MKAKEAIWRPNMLVVLWALIFNGAFASIYDCWDPEKLSRMKFPMTQRENLFKLFFCLKTHTLLLKKYNSVCNILLKTHDLKSIWVSKIKMEVLKTKFVLARPDFKESCSEIFSSLLDNPDFSDVTLACEDGALIHGHKFLLSAGSPFLRSQPKFGLIC